MIDQDNSQSLGKIVPFTLFAGGLIGIAYALISSNLLLALVFSILPLMGFFALKVVLRSDWFFYGIFIISYFLTAWTRYTGLVGVSYFLDMLLLLVLIQYLLQAREPRRKVDWRVVLGNCLLPGMSLWAFYCLFELFNSSSVGMAWISSRGLALSGLLISLVAFLVVRDFKIVKKLLFILSILTVLAMLKAFFQRYVGWDLMEVKWLNEGGAKTHLLGSGTRYFSFFTDAGNFGSNMGAAGVIFSCTAIYVKGLAMKSYYWVVAVLAFVGMFYSGTRGAIAVPVAGFLLFSILSKNLRISIPVFLVLVFAYCFLAFTYIGQGNQFIRRMRTAVEFQEDGSFNVRRSNQLLLKEYLEDKPFGVGLGLSGVENRDIADVFTTSIPHDSWYVKVWVETGIIGFIFYMTVLLSTIAQASWRIMFKVKDREIKGVLSAWLCGIFGLLVSAYGNAFWGQFPTPLIVYVGLVAALSGEFFEKQINREIKRG